MVRAKPMTIWDRAGRAESVEAVQGGMDLVAKPTAVGAGMQFAEQFFGDPGSGDVLVRVGDEQLEISRVAANAS